MKQAIIAGSIIGMSAAFLWHFSNIVIYGTHLIQEPNIIVLWAEIILIVGLLIFGICLFIGSLRNREKATK